MKLNRSILLSVLALFVLAVPSAYAGGHGKGCCGGGDAMAWKQDAKFDVVNLDNGVKVTVTADKPEIVQAIQKHITACDGSCSSQCGKGQTCTCKGCKEGGTCTCKGCKGCKDGNCTCKGCKDASCCAMAWKKDAKFEIAKLDNGVVLTVTTAHADAVKALQSHFASMGTCKHAAQKEGQGEAHRHGHGCAHHGTS